MATTIKNWKKYVAGKHRLNWQRDFFDHRLRDHYEVYEKTNYILMNPVRKGLRSGAQGTGAPYLRAWLVLPVITSQPIGFSGLLIR
jgi:putative transposase